MGWDGKMKTRPDWHGRYGGPVAKRSHIRHGSWEAEQDALNAAKLAKAAGEAAAGAGAPKVAKVAAAKAAVAKKAAASAASAAVAAEKTMKREIQKADAAVTEAKRQMVIAAATAALRKSRSKSKSKSKSKSRSRSRSRNRRTVKKNTHTIYRPASGSPVRSAVPAYNRGASPNENKHEPRRRFIEVANSPPPLEG